jgi:hypothetical protein
LTRPIEGLLYVKDDVQRLLARAAAMQRFGSFVSVAGFVVFFNIALLPTLSARPPLFPYIGMVICATIFILCERKAARFFGIVALVLAFIAGVGLYRRNARFDAQLQELVRQQRREAR